MCIRRVNLRRIHRDEGGAVVRGASMGVSVTKGRSYRVVLMEASSWECEGDLLAFVGISRNG